MADKICNALDCDNETKRSLASKSVRKALPDTNFDGSGRHLALCRDHYREYKKATKEDRKLESLGR